MSTTGNTDADVDAGERVKSDDKERLVDLESKDLGLDQAERLAVNLDKSFAGLDISRQHLSLIFWPISSIPARISFPDRTLHCATAVAVFFLPKHWTICVELIIAVSRFALQSDSGWLLG